MNSFPGTNLPDEILPPGLNPQDYVPFPDFGYGSPYEMTGTSTYYHSLQTTFERRFSNGLDVLAEYTFGKCRSDWRSPALSTIDYYRAPYLPGFGMKADYSYCDADVPNLVHISGLYQLPIGKGRRFLGSRGWIVNQVVGGWQMNWILTLEDGMPFDIDCPVATTADFGCHALLIPSQNIYAGPHKVNQWLNPAAFANPPVATAIGQTNFAVLGGGPTQAHGPGMHRLDFSVFKEFPISESKRFEFRTEVFNLLNTPFFSNPSFLDFTNPALFGKISSVEDGGNDPREIQFALKFYW